MVKNRIQQLSHRMSEWCSRCYYDMTVGQPAFPDWCIIEPTNYCNAKCYFCGRNILIRKFGFMETALFEKAVDEIALYGVKRLTLHLFGEPLMHPEIFNMVKYAKSKEKIGMVDFSTNGALLTDENIEKLIDSGLDAIHVSMDGATAKTYEKARKGLKFETVFRNTRNLIEAVHSSSSQKPFIKLQVIQTPAIAEEMQLFWQQWQPVVQEKTCVKVFVKEYEWWSGAKPDDVGGSSKEDPSNFYLRLPCGMQHQMAIFWNGEVTHCCQDVNGILKIGDLSTQSLYSIWRGKIAERLRRMVRDGRYGKIELCANCNHNSIRQSYSLKEIVAKYKQQKRRLT